MYPIIYNGSTYLPIRAISGLMREPIEWDGASKTIFIGRTLSNPSKKTIDGPDQKIINNGNSNRSNVKKAIVVDAYLKTDILVMYDFVIQNFKDTNGVQTYPIIYNGTTYLPIRAISSLMNETIKWDGITKTVSIGDGEKTIQENDIKVDISNATKVLKDFYEREEVLFYEATAKTTSFQEAKSLEQKQRIANAISNDYLNAQKLSLEIKELDVSSFKPEEIEVYDKVIAFTESTEYYIMVLENIAYLAAQDMDYSMLAETFLYFALDAQNKMEEARTQILSMPR